MVKCFSLLQNHRVVLPKNAAARRRSRLSIVNFVIPRAYAVIMPISDKKKYQLFTVIDSIEAFKVAVNVSRGEQTFPQIMADFSLFVH